MERIKDWKSYQKILNRRKNKKNRFFVYIKYSIIVILIGLLFYGFSLIYFYGKSILISPSKNIYGTGIRPISYIKKGITQKSKYFSVLNIKGGKSIKALKKALIKYFKYNPPMFKTIVNGLYVQKIGSYTVVYTIDPVLQKSVEKVFKEYAVPFGVFAAINPDTGAVLAFASYAHNKNKSKEISPLIGYPPGSLVKIITASAAIESKGFSPQFNICYNGALYGTNKSYWEQNIGVGTNNISFKMAFAKSCDVAFGKIAGYYLGRKLLSDYFDKFYFNKKIPFILNLRKSEFDIPKKFYQLELTGAGFENVKITPIQAALIAGSVINGGKMVKPYIIKEILSSSGKILYRHKNIKILSSPITVRTAYILKQMMIDTVTRGIAHADFYNINNQYMLPGVIAGGKTGTISGNHPTGLYQWFAGFGKMNGKKIALSSLVVEHPVWRIEGGGVAEKALFAYFFG